MPLGNPEGRRLDTLESQFQHADALSAAPIPGAISHVAI